MQKKSANYLSALLVVATSISFVAGCGKSIELKSRWRDIDVAVDNIDNEWGSATIYASKAKVSLTLLNDNHNIYIRLCSRDRQVHAHVLGMGLTVWFDPDGGKSKTFGIRFPLGMKDTHNMPMIRGRESDQGERLQKMLEKSTDELEILGSSEEKTYRISLTEAEIQGLNAKMGFTNGNLVYELKVPFIQDEEHLYAIGINTPDPDAGTVIGIGFETPEINMEEMRKKIKQGGMEMPGGGRMPGGGMRGGDRPDGRGKPERLNLWTKVTLASEPSVKD